MKKLVLLLSVISLSHVMKAQKLTTTTAVVSFDATTPKDPLSKAENRTVIGSLDKTTGALAFEAAVNNFSFSNPQMQTHFNSDKWLNSATYPKFSFTGKITNLAAVKFNRNGTYTARVTGNLTVKGITKAINTTAKIVVTGTKINATSNFTVKLADYGISGQTQIQSGKVATVAKVKVAANF